MKLSQYLIAAVLCINCIPVVHAQGISDLVVYIECTKDGQQKSRGSGVLVNEKGHVLTAGHVVPDGYECKGVPGNPTLPPRGLTKDPRSMQNVDAVLLRFTPNEGERFPSAKFCKLDDTLKGKQTKVRGFHQSSHELSIRMGVISTIVSDEKGIIETDAHTARGMSGGPVMLGDSSNLIGIIAGAAFDTSSQPIYFGVLAAEVIANIFELAEAPSPCQALGYVSNLNITLVNNYQNSTDYQYLKKKHDEKKTEISRNHLDAIKPFQETKKEMADFVNQIVLLAEYIERIPVNSERGKKAKQLFESNDYQAAREVLDTKEMNQEQQALLNKKQELAEEQEEISAHLKNLAGEFILKAKLAAVDYKLGDKRIPNTRKYFEQALKSDRAPEHLFEYALLLRKNNQFADAEKLYREALEGYRELEKANPDKYRPDVAMTLNNLGILITEDSSRRKEAEAFYQEALTIRRELAEANPEVYLPKLAGTLNNLGTLVSEDSSRHKEAKELYQKALTIRRELAEVNPDVYRPNLAVTLNNLGNLVSEDSSRRKEAEEFLQEALIIRRELATTNPDVYRSDLTLTLNNLGNLVAKDSSRRKKAEEFLQEALIIRRELAETNPDVYHPDVAMTLTNLGNLVKDDDSRRKEAKVFYQEALKTYRELTKANSGVYRPDLANVLASIGTAYLNWQLPKQAIPHLQEAHQLFTDLAKDAPEIFSERQEKTEKLLKHARADK